MLCDYHFDGSDESGQDLLDELRREGLLPYSTVFMMITAEATYAKVAEAAEAALDGYLIKPYTLASLADRIQAARTDGTTFAIINPGAFTHTSVAIRDAFAGVALPFIEVHISNVHKREAFRHHSYLSDIAVGVIVGLGVHGYRLALDYALTRRTTHSA